MAEYIEREAAIAICSNQYKECLRKNDWCGDTVAWNICYGIKGIPAADVVERKRGEWALEVHKEPTNYRWNVTAECPFCKVEKKEIWAGFFPTTSDSIVESIAMGCAESVKLPNFCQSCGADMRSHQNILCDQGERRDSE